MGGIDGGHHRGRQRRDAERQAAGDDSQRGQQRRHVVDRAGANAQEECEAGRRR